MEEELIKHWLTVIAQHSLCIFVAFACLPIKLTRAEPKTTFPVRLHWSVKLVLYALLTVVSSDGRRPNAVWYSYVIYRLIDVTVRFCIDWVQIMVGYIDIEWARRWNNIVSIILCHVIYRKLKPAVESTVGVPIAPLTNVLAVLIVSSMMSGLARGAVVLVAVAWWFYPHNGADVRVVEYPT